MKVERNENLIKECTETLASLSQHGIKIHVSVLLGEILGWLGDTRDLAEFVGIEGGKYELEDLGKADIKPFEIGKYPVTNQWYKEFIEDKGYSKEEYWSTEGWKWRNKENIEYPRCWHERKWKCPNAPVVTVSWYEADAFCRWLTKARNDGYTYRLPTEEEWQAAAAGKKGREYAWGNEDPDGRCNDGYKIDKTSSVGIFHKGCTPEGVADMSGNVWEWTCSSYDNKKRC